MHVDWNGGKKHSFRINTSAKVPATTFFKNYLNRCSVYNCTMKKKKRVKNYAIMPDELKN